MKYLILIFSIFINLSLFANEINYTSDGKTFYIYKKDCLNKNAICYAFPVGEHYSDFDLIDEYIDDLTKPLYKAAQNEITCGAVEDDPNTADIDESKTQEQDCLEKFESLSCEGLEAGFNWYKVRLEDNSKVYCTAIAGYEQKLSGRKILVLNQTKKDARLLLEAQKKSESNALKAQMKLIKYGQELIALIGIRNKAKTGLTSEQVLSMTNTYAPIQSLLLSGSLVTAKSQIEAITPSEAITQEDKDYILGKINYYLGL